MDKTENKLYEQAMELFSQLTREELIAVRALIQHISCMKERQ